MNKYQETGQRNRGGEESFCNTVRPINPTEAEKEDERGIFFSTLFPVWTQVKLSRLCDISHGTCTRRDLPEAPLIPAFNQPCPTVLYFFLL